MHRISISAGVLFSAALSMFVLFAPTALAGDFAVDGAFGDANTQMKFGSSGQAYHWRAGC